MHTVMAPNPARMSAALGTLQGRVEVLLSLLSRALAHCRAEPELLLPLARVAMQTLPLEGGGEGLTLLQLQAAGGSRLGRCCCPCAPAALQTLC